MIQRIADSYKQAHAYINSNRDVVGSTMSKVSSFWSGIFNERPNFPDINELLTFRRSNLVYGLGGWLNAKVPDEKERFVNFVNLVKQFIPKDFIVSLKEPLFGAPYIFEYDGIVASHTFVMLSAITWRCKHFVDKFLSHKPSLNICDIGAGWGGVAYQLHSTLPVNSCTIIDLPQNLFLSSIYLQTTMPSKTGCFVQGGNNAERIQNPSKDALYFLLPQYADLIHIKLDLIVNSYSLQEMDKETVQSYMNWIFDRLSPEGLFVSINSHNKAGIKKASEYGFKKFKIVSLRPFQKTPSGFFNTIPYEIVVTKKEMGIIYVDSHLDALCELMQLGLDGDISDLCNNFIKGSLNNSEQLFLDLLGQFFRQGTIKNKLVVLAKLKESMPANSIIQYLEGCLLYALHKDKAALTMLSHACENKLQDFARTKALTIMCSIDHGVRNSEYYKEIHLLSPSLLNEIQRVIRGSSYHRLFIQTKLSLVLQVNTRIINAAKSKLKKLQTAILRK